MTDLVEPLRKSDESEDEEMVVYGAGNAKQVFFVNMFFNYPILKA
jgi:hypothetical protein